MPDLSSDAPKGHGILAGGMIPRHTSPPHLPRTPEGCGIWNISPQIPFIVFDPTASKDLHIFLLKRSLPMVFLLLEDISLNHSDSRRTHRERAVPFLPGKLGDSESFMHPL
jgi:hypothetical protein